MFVGWGLLASLFFLSTPVYRPDSAPKGNSPMWIRSAVPIERDAVTTHGRLTEDPTAYVFIEHAV